MIDVDKEFYTKITKNSIPENNRLVTEKKKETIKTSKPKNNVTNIKIIVREIPSTVNDIDDIESIEKTLSDTIKLANKTKLPF